MKSLALRILIGVILYIFATPAGMAQQTIRQDSRDIHYEASDRKTHTRRHDQQTFSLDAMLPAIEGESHNERQLTQTKHQKRRHHHSTRHLCSQSHCRQPQSFAPARTDASPRPKPQPQGARQEIAATIRFLHLQAIPFV